MDFTAFMENLKTHEIEMKTRADREPQKKIYSAFKAFPREHKKKSVVTLTISEDDEEMKDEKDEVFSKLIKTMEKMCWPRGPSPEF